MEDKEFFKKFMSISEETLKGAMHLIKLYRIMNKEKINTENLTFGQAMTFFSKGEKIGKRSNDKWFFDINTRDSSKFDNLGLLTKEDILATDYYIIKNGN